MPRKGQKMSEEAKRKISKNNARFWLGKKLPYKVPTVFKKGHIPMGNEVGHFKKGHKGYWVGKKMSIEHRKKMSEAKKGKKSYLWKGGITSIGQKIRHTFEYKLWREAVFKRDDYTCIWCGQRGGRLNADHIKPFAFYPEIRFAIDNGRTLCEDCHKKTPTFQKRKNIYDRKQKS